MTKKSFSLAPMTRSILVLTLVLWLLPCAFSAYALLTGQRIAGVIAAGLFALYAIVWLFCRPYRFELSSDLLNIVFPCWQRKIAVEDIAAVRLLQRDGLKKQFGRAMRVGAGGLWGGFGWLWTSKNGFIEFYVSRLDGLVLIERRSGKNILITPEHAEEFVAAAEGK